MVSFRRSFFSILAICLGIPCIQGDETTSFGWLPGDGIRGFDGKVISTTLWDRDGPGGEDPVLVVGGDFSVAGEILANNIAIWNGTDWEALGDGLSGEVHAFAVLPNGDLVVGGNFVWAEGNILVRAVARWDGTDWHGFGTGMGNSSWVYALAVLPNGDLVAGGSFTTAGEVSASSIARWNGESWSAFGTGLAGSGGRIIYDMAVLPNGKLVIAGTFSGIDGNAITSIASWDGAIWSALGDGAFGIINDLAVFPNGNLAVAGGFSVNGIGTIRNVAIWDGVAWSSIGSNAFGEHLNGEIFEVTILPDESIIAGGGFWTGDGAPANFVARWNGVAWEQLGTGTNNFVLTVIVMPNGDLVAGGTFLFADDTHAARIARWDGQDWRYFGSGFGGTYTGSVLSDAIYDFLTLPNGNVIAGGAFQAAGSVTAQNVAMWNGISWSPLGDGLDGDVLALARLPNGNILAGGAFKKAGDQDARGLAVWNGSSWAPYAPLSDGVTNPVVRSLLVRPNGDVIVGGQFFRADADEVLAYNVVRWDGSAWRRLGDGLNGAVMSLIELQDGSIVAGGDFVRSGTATTQIRIARWNGEAWQPMGSGMNSTVKSLLFDNEGALLAVGRFTQAGGVTARGIARWDGASAWTAISSTGISLSSTGLHDAIVLPNGNIVVGGYLSVQGTNPVSGNIALWDGQSWKPFGNGAGIGLSPGVFALEPRGNDGGFLMGGGFLTVNGTGLAHFARWGALSGGTFASLPVRVRASRLGGILRLHFEAAEEEQYCVQYTTGLKTWQTILDDQSGDTEYVENDPQRLAEPRIFYRAFRD